MHKLSCSLGINRAKHIISVQRSCFYFFKFKLLAWPSQLYWCLGLVVSKYVLSSKLAISSTENSSNLLSPYASFLAQNTPQAIWWPGSARTHWGSLEHSPRSSIAGLKGGPRWKGRGKGDGVGGMCRGRVKIEKVGSDRVEERNGGEGKSVDLRRVCAVLKIHLKSSGP